MSNIFIEDDDNLFLISLVWFKLLIVLFLIII